MPNWVATQLSVDNPEVLDAMFRAPTEEDGPVEGLVLDFNLIVPQPPNIEVGGCSGVHPPGVVCWYEWNTNNWGTKWGACHAKRVSPSEVRFDTAWSLALPVLVKLSRMFPAEKLRVKYADEDLGYNLGAFTLINGVLLEEQDPEPGSKEALDFAAQLHYGQSYDEVVAEWNAEEVEYAKDESAQALGEGSN